MKSGLFSRYLPPLLIFTATFTLAFITGSLTFIPKESSAAQSSSSAEINLTVNSTISMTITPQTANLSATPTTSSVDTQEELTVTINTNNPTGYTLDMNTLTADTALTHTNTTSTIPSTNNTPAATLPTNTWGYNSHDNLTGLNHTTNTAPTPNTFLEIPPLSTPDTINTTNTPVANHQTKVNLGAKVDATLSAGIYSNTLQFTATTSYISPPEVPTGTAMQLIGTDYNCPTTRTRVVDARDNATYWIQKLADGKCWMLTNLAYGGGGTNTYSDVKTITNSNTLSYVAPYYMIPTGSNKTVEPQDPSTSTTGTGQYGYLYNWCAAMGAQTGTSACMNATTPLPDQNISICPAGWRLPTGGSGGEYETLNAAINNGSTTGDSGLKSIWFGMYGGYWNSGFIGQGNGGNVWSSVQYSATSSYFMGFSSGTINPGAGNFNKRYGQSAKCVLHN